MGEMRGAEIIQFVPRSNPRRTYNDAVLARIVGVPANAEPNAPALSGQGDPNIYDTAPCELPSVWPDFYHASDKDPA
ncbi:hypothetical protein IC762_12240 [Bradyrhizobium genosp. L]|uniref:hypothetical protein n=1 Tax=Bradyrhizobium genosp. L TaxID=83637 RepID=UPI0018A27917|nr:hypothetical protein [Bradyrhizobium genosp. L]QPF87014.1 hypothetical protein IC762_12240 [Bradyrhizobium genosp. L]